MNHWTDPQVAELSKLFTARKRIVTFTKTCPAMKNPEKSKTPPKRKKGGN
jgi:hypothetical protein